MKNKLNFLFPVIIIFIGFQFTNDYLEDPTIERRKQLNQLITSSEKVIGKLDKTFKEKTIIIAKIPVKYYKVPYHFSINSKNYSGIKKQDKPPTQWNQKISYLPSNPEVNSADPQEELNSLGKQKSIGLILGLSLILIGFILGYFRFNKLQKKRV